MSTDSVLWYSRVCIFNAFKSQTQGKLNMKYPFLLLKLFLFFISYIYVRLVCFISFPTFCFLTNVLEVVDVEIPFSLYIKSSYIVLMTQRLIQVPNNHLWLFSMEFKKHCCSWFIKVSLFQGSITERNFSIICLS